MKKLTALLLVLAMLVTLAACTKKDEKKEPKDSTAPIETKAPAQLVDAPVLNINEIYGLSPEGQKATLANTLSLRTRQPSRKATTRSPSVCTRWTTM